MAPTSTPITKLAVSKQEATVASLRRRLARALRRQAKMTSVRNPTSSSVHDPPADLDGDQQNNDEEDDDRQPPPSTSPSTSKIGSGKGKEKQESSDDEDDRESGEEQDGDDTDEDSDGAEGGDDDEDSEEGSEGEDDDAEGGVDDEDSEEGSEGRDDDEEVGGDDEDSDEGSEEKEGKDDNADRGGDNEESSDEEVRDDKEADGDIEMGEGDEDEDDELDDKEPVQVKAGSGSQRGRAKGTLGKGNEGVNEGTANSQAAKRTGGNKSPEESVVRVRVGSPKKTTRVGATTAPPNACQKCVETGTVCVKVGTKEGSACALCRKKKKKCVPHEAKPPPAKVKKGDSAPLPKRPSKKAPSVPAASHSAPATSQKHNRRASRSLARDSTAPLPQRALKVAPSVPANSQKSNRRPPRDLSRYSTPDQSDKGPVVIVKPNLLHVLSPPDPPPAKKRRMAQAPALGGPFNETNVQVPSNPPSPNPPSPNPPSPNPPSRSRTLELPQLLEARLQRIEEMQLSLSERQTATLHEVQNIHELLISYCATRRNEGDSE